MTRTASKQDGLRALGARPVVADALDPDAVAQAVASAEPEVIVQIVFVIDNSERDLTPSELARLVRLSPAATGRAVDALVRNKIVSRREDHLDRRVKRLALTATAWRRWLASPPPAARVCSGSSPPPARAARGAERRAATAPAPGGFAMTDAVPDRLFDRTLIGASIVVVLGAFMTILDTTIVNVAIDSLSRDFDTFRAAKSPNRSPSTISPRAAERLYAPRPERQRATTPRPTAPRAVSAAPARPPGSPPRRPPQPQRWVKSQPLLRVNSQPLTTVRAGDQRVVPLPSEDGLRPATRIPLAGRGGVPGFAGEHRGERSAYLAGLQALGGARPLAGGTRAAVARRARRRVSRLPGVVTTASGHRVALPPGNYRPTDRGRRVPDNRGPLPVRPALRRHDRRAGRRRADRGAAPR
jgi:hypothetical protein